MHGSPGLGQVAETAQEAPLFCFDSIQLKKSISARRPGLLTGVTGTIKLTYMTKTQVYLREDELQALRAIAGRSGRSIADLVREAIRKVWLLPPADGPVALWDGEPKNSSIEHDSIYDDV